MKAHFFAHGGRVVMRHFQKQKRGHARRVFVVRAICGRVVGNVDTVALRESNVVACEMCMVMKDAWLQLPKRKPLTVRRAAQLIRNMKETHAPPPNP